MSRFHIHIAVDDLQRNIAFYSALFGATPTVSKDDYAKWQLDDPKLNFAISTRAAKRGLDHVGLQAEDDAELASLRQRIDAAGIQGVEQRGTACCYSISDKYWLQDPQGIAWETFHSLASTPMFGQADGARKSAGACCAPAADGGCDTGATS